MLPSARLLTRFACLFPPLVACRRDRLVPVCPTGAASRVHATATPASSIVDTALCSAPRRTSPLRSFGRPCHLVHPVADLFQSADLVADWFQSADPVLRRYPRPALLPCRRWGVECIPLAWSVRLPRGRLGSCGRGRVGFPSSGRLRVRVPAARCGCSGLPVRVPRSQGTSTAGTRLCTPARGGRMEVSGAARLESRAAFLSGIDSVCPLEKPARSNRWGARGRT